METTRVGDLIYIIQTVDVNRKLENVRSKIDAKKNLSSVDLQLFRQFCCHKDPHIAKLACGVIVNFVKQNRLCVTEAITWFISTLQSIENINAIIFAIRDLLLQSFNVKNFNLAAFPFGLVSPQHPFVLILKKDSAHWPIIDSHIQYMFRKGNLKAVFLMLSPYFKIVLWSPPGNVNHGCQRSTWKLLINNYSPEFSDFITRTVWWLRLDDENSVLNASHYLPDLFSLDSNIDIRQKANFICILSTEIACKTAKLGHDPSSALEFLSKMLKKYPETTDIVLIMIAESLPSCPVALINEFLIACIDLININGISDVVVVWIIIGAVLPWIIHPVVVTKDINSSACSLFNIVDGKTKVPPRKETAEQLQNDSWFIECITCYTESYWAFLIARTIGNFFSNNLLELLSDFCVTSDVVRENFFVNLIVTGVFLSSDDLNTQLNALDVLVKKNAGFQLSLIMFKLSRTVYPELHLKLLHCLPLTAVVKENIPCVLATIRSLSLSGQPVLVQLSYSLYLTLWKTEERCYQFLFDQIMSYMQDENLNLALRNYEMDIAVTAVIRDVCSLKAEFHGKEWVKVLSDIMSSYVEKRECIPLILALEAILKMCEAKVVDVFTVYEELAKKHLFGNKRSEVIKQLCHMIGLIFQQTKESSDESHEQITIEALSVLWRIIEESSEIDVFNLAVSVLSIYDFEQMPLTVIPDELKKDLRPPPQFAVKKRADSEEELSFIPGLFWLEYLRNALEERKPKVVDLLTLWLSQETKNFSRFMFNLVQKERDSVRTLHDKSIFKVVIDHCKRFIKKNAILNVDSIDLDMVLYCLKILNRQPPKVLPRFNWSFLDEFLKYENDDIRTSVLSLWAKESITSASAKSCMEMYLKKLDVRTCDKRKFLFVLEIVTNFCVGVPSETISSFLSASMQFVLEKCGIDEHERSLYHSTCMCLRTAFKNPEIEEHNCEAICKNIVNWWENSAVQSECFDDLVDAAKEMPLSYVNYLTSLNLSTEISTENLYKILKLRCSVALNDSNNPFVWLNDCIEATTQRLEDKILFFERTLNVFVRNRQSTYKWPWLLQFLDRLRVSVEMVSEEICSFMCDVFIFCIVNTSSYHPFLRDATSIEDCYEYFPQALRNVMVDGVSSQVIEWLSYSCKIVKISEQHKQLFIRAIIASRKNQYLQKLSVWSNIVQKF